MSGKITVIGLVVAVFVLSSLVMTPVAHARNGTTPSVSLNALLKPSRYYPAVDDHDIQPPAKFDFSPSNSTLSDIKIIPPATAYITLYNDGSVVFAGQARTTTENTTVSTTRIIDFDGHFRYDRTDHNKITGATTYHMAPGDLGNFELGKIKWSNVTYSVKTFDNGTGILSMKGKGG